MFNTISRVGKQPIYKKKVPPRLFVSSRVDEETVNVRGGGGLGLEALLNEFPRGIRRDESRPRTAPERFVFQNDFELFFFLYFFFCFSIVFLFIIIIIIIIIIFFSIFFFLNLVVLPPPGRSFTLRVGEHTHTHIHNMIHNIYIYMYTYSRSYGYRFYGILKWSPTMDCGTW